MKYRNKSEDASADRVRVQGSLSVLDKLVKLDLLSLLGKCLLEVAKKFEGAVLCFCLDILQYLRLRFVLGTLGCTVRRRHWRRLKARLKAFLVRFVVEVLLWRFARRA